MKEVVVLVVLTCAILCFAGLLVSCAGTSDDALEALGASVAPEQKDTASLISALSAAQDEDAKIAVIRELIARPGQDVADALQQTIDDEKGEDAKGWMVGEIAKGTTPEIIQLLIKIYQKGDDGMFTGPAAEALVKIPGEEMTKILIEGFKKQYTECAAAAVADALSRRKDKKVTEALLMWVLDDIEPMWMIAHSRVIAALGGRNDARITEVLLDSLENAEYEGTCEAAVQALALEGDEKVTTALMKALRTSDIYSVREEAAKSLGKRWRVKEGERKTIEAALGEALAKEKKDRVKKTITKMIAQIELAEKGR